MKGVRLIYQRIVSGWNLMRVLKLALALIILISAIVASDGLVIVAGAFLIGQALLNVGCCGVNNCPVDFEFSKGRRDETQCEEIKP